MYNSGKGLQRIEGVCENGKPFNANTQIGIRRRRVFIP